VVGIISINSFLLLALLSHDLLEVGVERVYRLSLLGLDWLGRRRCLENVLEARFDVVEVERVGHLLQLILLLPLSCLFLCLLFLLSHDLLKR